LAGDLEKWRSEKSTLSDTADGRRGIPRPPPAADARAAIAARDHGIEGQCDGSFSGKIDPYLRAAGAHVTVVARGQ